MASESADKSMWLVAEDFYARYGAASQGTLFPTQLLTNRVFGVQNVQLTFSVAKGRSILSGCNFNLSGIRWQAASAWLRSLGPGPPQLFSLLLSPCKRKEELSHSAPQELRPWVKYLILSALLSSPCRVQTLSQAVEWSRNQRNFFSFLQLWHGSEECHTVQETNVF